MGRCRPNRKRSSRRYTSATATQWRSLAARSTAFDDPGDLGGVVEVGVERRRAVEAGQQAVDLDQLQVVEAEAVAGRRAERRVVRVLGSAEDGAEAAPAVHYRKQRRPAARRNLAAREIRLNTSPKDRGNSIFERR